MELKEKIDAIAIHFFGGNNVKFAEKTETSEANIRNYRKGASIPKVDFLIKLNEVLEINFDWLLTDKGGMTSKTYSSSTFQEADEKYLLRTDRKRDLQTVPLYDFKASAGLVKLFNDKYPNIIDYISIPNLPKVDGAISITGDSMYPLLKAGDIIMYKIVKNDMESIFWGEMYLLSYQNDGETLTMVKYIQKSDKGDDYVKLVSQNIHHAPKDVHLSKIKALALIKASIRINTMA